LLKEKLFSELFRGQSGVLHGRESVECTPGLEAIEAYLIEAAYDKVAAAVIVTHHLFHFMGAVAQGFDGSDLGYDRNINGLFCK
jgi:hypothetical protein